MAPNFFKKQRDEFGCLISDGYSYNKTFGVCLKESEINELDRQILKYAINYTTQEPGLTVVNISKSVCEKKECFIVELDIFGRKKTIDVFAEYKTFCTPEQRGPGKYCIQVWEPVCGSNNKTYSNSCIACLDSSVEYYTKGECK